MRAPGSRPVARLVWTTTESADRSREDARFAVAEQASEKGGPAHLVFVQGGSVYVGRGTSPFPSKA